MISAYWTRDYSALNKDLKETLCRWMGSGHQSGAYTVSPGDRGFAQACIDFLDKRDAKYNPDFSTTSRGTLVYLSDGASGSIVTLMEALVDTSAPKTEIDIASHIPNMKSIMKNVDLINQSMTDKTKLMGSGIFCPVPQYPLYSATLQRLGASIIPYELDEEEDWKMPSIETLEFLYAKSISAGIFPKAIVAINPGNPSGNVLTRDDIIKVLKFAFSHDMVVLSDEVYQDNIWTDKEFHGMRKVAMEEDIKAMIASFHSCSKGLYGECGVRGGFMATDNFPAHFTAIIEKSFSVRLCGNVTGQLAIALVCCPPEGESKALYEEERNRHHTELKLKSEILVKALNDLEGVTCNVVRGALYAFPRIRMPAKAIAEAKKQEIPVDTFYCVEMLKESGIVTVPGSGFKQKDGTSHYRITILPDRADLTDALDRLKLFHEQFMSTYQ
eukprot:GHVH01006147.1.p1 GENE.GHVH01006147.1~~GHVH01006147.1.p1  ORF type:complete len:442 (-),score=59.18 GHVH01006147.1:1521-2846(-)